MEQALRDLFERHKTVVSAYLGRKVIPSTDGQSYLLVVVGPKATRFELGHELGRALLYYSMSHPVDVTFTPPGRDHLLTSIEPFYTRGARRGLFRR